jgi:hypothetical protein
VHAAGFYFGGLGANRPIKMQSSALSQIPQSVKSNIFRAADTHKKVFFLFRG